MRKDGAARVAYAAALRDSAGERPVEIVFQNPGLVRISEGGAAPSTISFNGEVVTAGQRNLPERQAKLLETVMVDFPESILTQAVTGEPFRRIGDGFRLTGQGIPATSNETVEVFQLMPVRVTQKALPDLRARMLAFDSISGMLRFVNFLDAKGVKVATHLEGWKTVNGESYPGVVKRIENGTEVMRITINAISVGDKRAAEVF